jgi:UDP-N-acetylmuramoyl-tripeptide--D-alanyl-D-alanine ligase
MLIWNALELSCALGTNCSISGNAIRFNSKDIKPGDIFIALQTGKSSGAVYAQEALSLGASGCIVNAHEVVEKSEKIISVPDTMHALEKMANYKRKASSANFTAITGTCGKTTVTKMTFEAVSSSYRTFSTYKNFNNRLGLLLNLASMPSDAEQVILELGMNAPGEIADLALQTRHQVALITNIGPGHIAHFKSIKQIAFAKAEIFAGMQNGVALLPSNGLHSQLLRSLAQEKGLKVYTFGTARGAGVRIIKYIDQVAEIDVFGSRIQVKRAGLHNVKNISAALLCSTILKADLKKSLNALESFVPPAGRGKALNLNLEFGEIHLLDRSYNANPLSVKSSLEEVGVMSAKRKVLAIADMLELGKRSEAYHKALVSCIFKAGINKVIAIGVHTKQLYELLPGKLQMFHASDVESSLERIYQSLNAEDLFVVQGSRSMQMSKLVSFLLDKGNLV